MILYKKDQAVLKILDEVNCALINVHPDHLTKLVDQFAIFSPTSRYDPRFQFGNWDGKIKFFQAAGKTYNHFIPEIIEFLYSLDYQIELIDNRKAKVLQFPQIDENYFSHILNKDGEPIVLRPYQVEGVNAVTKDNGGIIVAGTGAGKTMMNAALCKLALDLSLRVITVVPNLNLIRQTKKLFQSLNIETGEYSGKTKDMNHPNVVSTWQALQNFPELIANYDVIIIDECHGVKSSAKVKGNVLKKLLTEAGKNLPYRFGLTGTMPDNKLDRLSVLVSLGEPKYEVPAADLIKEGFLAKPQISVLQLQEDLRSEYEDYLESEKEIETLDKPKTYAQYKKELFPEFAQERHYLENEEQRLAWIAHFLLLSQGTGKGNVFCIVPTVKMGKKLAKLCNATFVYGSDPVEVREEVYGLFETNNNVLVLANAQVASVGINIERIFHLVLIDMGRSFIRIIQSIGRGLRTAKDKDSVLITDIGSDLPFSASQLRKRITHYKEAQYPYSKKVIKDYHVNF